MATSDVSWKWLEEFAREARDVIERLYTEGRTALGVVTQERVEPAKPPQQPKTERPKNTQDGAGKAGAGS